MKIKFALFALIFAAGFAGCATADKFNALQIGMTEDQVITILGKPDSKSAQGNVEYFTYYLTNDSTRNNDQPYAVRFAGGKVESFGRFAQLFDIYNRPVAGNPQSNAGYLGSVAALSSNGPSLATELQKLKTLKDEGGLTDEEFQRAKDRLLNGQK
jgi:hypothetical protein